MKPDQRVYENQWKYLKHSYHYQVDFWFFQLDNWMKCGMILTEPELHRVDWLTPLAKSSSNKANLL